MVSLPTHFVLLRGKRIGAGDQEGDDLSGTNTKSPLVVAVVVGISVEVYLPGCNRAYRSATNAKLLATSPAATTFEVGCLVSRLLFLSLSINISFTL